MAVQPEMTGTGEIEQELSPHVQPVRGPAQR